MTPATVEALERIWAGGGRARDAATPEWREAIGDAPGLEPDEAELRLLALAGQAARMTLRAASDDAPARPDLPRLALPTLPDAVRPRFRDAVAASQAPHLAVELLAARGWSAHPLDWMPSPKGTHAPAPYRPWVEWLASEAEAAEVLTEETWDELTPAPRRMMLYDLRVSDPDAARAVMEARLASRPAEERVELVATMRAGLSEADAEYLRTLLGDRSGKVRAEATRLLATLNADEAGETDAEAIRAVIDVRTRGLLRRSKSFRPSKGARGSDLARIGTLHDALRDATLSGVAAALDTTAQAFASGWEWGECDPRHDFMVAALIARTGADADVRTALEPALACAETSDALIELAPRIDAFGWRMFIERTLSTGRDGRGSTGLVGTLMRVPESVRLLGAAGADVIERSALLARLVAYEAEREGHDRRPADALAFLGLVADRDGAARALREMEAVGRPLADPELALLRLNATLPHQGAVT